MPIVPVVVTKMAPQSPPKKKAELKMQEAPAEPKKPLTVVTPIEEKLEILMTPEKKAPEIIEISNPLHSPGKQPQLKKGALQKRRAQLRQELK